MTYYGGKNNSGAFQTIINQIPPHDCYIEPFLGSGAIMRRKRPAHVNIAIDADASCINSIRSVVPGVIAFPGDAISYLTDIAENGLPGKKCFIYADPPYLFAVRSSKRPVYAHEFGYADQHMQLLDALKELSRQGCMIMISGYWSELYERELKHWRTLTYNAITRSGRVAEEWLWMNYPEPVALHDYRFLGENFRERERIKRKVNRWQARLERMPLLERRALLLAMSTSGIAESDDGGRRTRREHRQE